MTTQRLPIPGQDKGTWGDILNGYLLVSHAADGSLNSAVIGSGQIQANSITNALLDIPTQSIIASVAAKYVKPSSGIPSTDLSTGAQTSLSAASTAVQSVNGLTGTSLSLASTNLSDFNLSSISDGQVLTYNAATSKWKNQVAPSAPVSSVAGRTGDVVLTSTDVGLANVNNTSDANKPVSTATQTALNLKATTSTLATVATSGSYADLSNQPTIPTVNNATAGTKGIIQLGGDLAGSGSSASAPTLASTANVTSIINSTIGTNSTVSGAVQKANNLSDLASSSTALTNLGAASILTTTSVKTSTYTASANSLVPSDATAGTFAVTLPTAPADTTRVTIKKIDATANVVSVVTGGSDVFNKAGGSTSVSLSLLNQAVTIQYSATAAIWYVVGDDLPFTSLQSQFDPAGAAAAASGTAISAASYGAVGNAQTVNNVTASTGSKTVTVTGSTPFVSGDVGKTCVVYNRYVAVGVITTIATVVSSSSVTLTANAGITGSGTSYFFTWGTDDSAAIQSALNAAGAKVWNGTAPNLSGFNSSGLVDVILPATAYQSGYLITSQLNVPTGVRIDVPGMLYNAISSRLAPGVKFADYSGGKQFNYNGLYGGGISIGTVSTYATAQFESIRIWYCGGISTAPTSLAGTPSTTGGTLTASTYYYVVTGIDSSGGESLVSNEISVTTTGSTSSVSLTWTTNAAFSTYRVYRGYVARGEYKYYGSISTGSYTDTGAAATTLMPTPPGTGIAFFGYHLEVGRAYIVSCGCAVVSSGTDQFWGFLDMIGCTTGFRSLESGDIHAPAVVVDTCGGTNVISGYVTEGGIFFELNAAFITMTVTCFAANVTTLSPVINIGPILTNAQTGTTNNTMDMRIHANNLGGTVLKLSNIVDSKFEVIATNDVGYGFSSNPITTALAYGSNIGASVNVKMTVASGITAFTGTQAGVLEVVQNSAITFYPTSASSSPNMWIPSDHGLVAWVADPYEVTGSGAPTSGTLYLSRLKVRSSTTITYLWWWCNAIGSGFTAGDTLSGLYDTSGNLLSGSSDFGASTPTGGSGNLATLGWVKVPLTTPQTVSTDVYAAVLINASTMPQLARGPGVSATNGFANLNLSTGGTATANSRFISSGTSLTALPATVTYAGATSPASGNYYTAAS